MSERREHCTDRQEQSPLTRAFAGRRADLSPKYGGEVEDITTPGCFPECSASSTSPPYLGVRSPKRSAKQDCGSRRSFQTDARRVRGFRLGTCSVGVVAEHPAHRVL